MKNSTVLLLLFLSPFLAKAQMTGSFQQSITFAEADYNFTRNLYFYVPQDYDASQSYKLVVGFRGGPHSNAGQFRDQLTFLADSIGAIILCPENADHFWNEEGLTKQLFQYSVDTTMAMYNIDPDYVYLTGLSYGGRHAVIIAMDTDAGVIPNLRGVIPFAAGLESQMRPDYDNIADFPPACICIGLNDSQNFKTVAQTLHDDITTNGGVSFLNEISGVGHTVDFSTYPDEMMECFQFIESQYEINAVSEVSSNSLSIYPNPTANLIDISYDKSFIPTQAFIINTAGQILINLEPMQKQIDVSSLSTGVNFLILISQDRLISQRITIIR